MACPYIVTQKLNESSWASKNRSPAQFILCIASVPLLVRPPSKKSQQPIPLSSRTCVAAARWIPPLEPVASLAAAGSRLMKARVAHSGTTKPSCLPRPSSFLLRTEHAGGVDCRGCLRRSDAGRWRPPSPGDLPRRR
jgi:hypothetical protein